MANAIGGNSSVTPDTPICDQRHRGAVAPIYHAFGRIKSVGDNQVARNSVAEYVRTVGNAHYIFVSE